MKRIIILPLITGAGFLFAQQTAPEVFNNAGRTVHNAGVIITHSVGEPIITTHVAPGILVTQGFLQPEDNVTDIDGGFMSMALTIFPNPAQQGFFVKGDLTGRELLSLFDSRGREVMQTTVRKDESIPVGHLTSGVYEIRIIDTDQKRWFSAKLVKE